MNKAKKAFDELYFSEIKYDEITHSQFVLGAKHNLLFIVDETSRQNLLGGFDKFLYYILKNLFFIVPIILLLAKVIINKDLNYLFCLIFFLFYTYVGTISENDSRKVPNKEVIYVISLFIFSLSILFSIGCLVDIILYNSSHSVEVLIVICSLSSAWGYFGIGFLKSLKQRLECKLFFDKRIFEEYITTKKFTVFTNNSNSKKKLDKLFSEKVSYYKNKGDQAFAMGDFSNARTYYSLALEYVSNPLAKFVLKRCLSSISY